MTEENKVLRRSDLCIRAGQLGVRPHELGHIKIGRQSDQTKTAAGGRTYHPPEKLDYFLITRKQRDANGNFEVDAEAMAVVGEGWEGKPKRLKVFLPYNDPELDLTVFYASYVNSRCMCRGNGTVALSYSEDTKTYRQVECAGRDCKTYQDKKCKLTGILPLILPNIPRLGGVYVFRTTSYNSIAHLQANLAMFFRLTEGNLSGVPLELVVEPEIKQPGDGPKVTIYTVSLQYAGTIEDMRSQALALADGNREFRSRLALAERNVRELMSETVDAPDDDGDSEGVEAEYYPPADPPPPEKPAIAEPQAKAEPESSPSAADKPDGDAPAPAPVAKITLAQKNLLFQRAKMNGYNEDEIKIQYMALYGVDHVMDIPRSEFNTILKWASGPRGK